LLLGEEMCRVWQDERISYGQWNWLIVVEPQGDAYREVFSEDSTLLDEIADCARGRCKVALGALRKFSVNRP
jgi:hypothetical protein